MKLTKLKVALVGVCAIALTACGDDDETTSQPANETEMAMFEVSVLNLTYNQPLSPLAIALHADGYAGWSEGSAASMGLEQLAESGDNSMFLSTATDNAAVVAASSGSGLILPAGVDTVQFSVDMASLPTHITAATMLVNTNDAFTGTSAYPIADLAVGSSYVIPGYVWDSGTEANDELTASIPGPAAGGEGYNAEREAHDFVRIHSGVVTQADGLTESALDESHRFLGPVAHIVVTRLN